MAVSSTALLQLIVSGETGPSRRWSLPLLPLADLSGLASEEQAPNSHSSFPTLKDSQNRKTNLVPNFIDVECWHCCCSINISCLSLKKTKNFSLENWKVFFFLECVCVFSWRLWKFPETLSHWEVISIWFDHLVDKGYRVFSQVPSHQSANES